MRLFELPVEVNAVLYHPDGRTLLTTDPTGTLRAWDLASERSAVVLTHALLRSPGTMRLSPDGRLLAIQGHWTVLCQPGPMPPGPLREELPPLCARARSGRLTATEPGLASARSSPSSRVRAAPQCRCPPPSVRSRAFGCSTSPG